MPDPRDFAFHHHQFPRLTQQSMPAIDELPDSVDLRCGDEGEVFLTDADDQGPLNSSTAHAVLGMIEYFERREGRTFSGSRLFLYKVARNLRNRRSDLCADTGADLRTTLKAVRQFGIPSEELWPDDPTLVDKEPPAFVYHAAKPVADFRFVRVFAPAHQPPQPGHFPESVDAALTQRNLLMSILARGYPIMFGFSVPSSISREPDIPLRPDYDCYLGGMAVLATGYEMHHYGRNQGALRIRASWGTSWGDDGNGWLPATCIESGLASDFWTLTRAVFPEQRPRH